MTFRVSTATHVPNFRKTEISSAKFTEIILHAELRSDALGELTDLFQSQWPNVNFTCLRRSFLGALTRVVPSALIACPLKLWVITASTVVPKFKDKSRHSVYAPITYFAAVDSTLRREYAHQI